MKDKNSEFRLFWRMLRKNKLAMLGLIILTLIVLTAIFANVLAPYDYTAQNLANMKKFPSMEHPFGTDEFGRDILSRIIYGTRQSLVIGVGSIAIAVLAGGLIGLISGFYGGWLDNLLMRITDGSSLKNLLIAIAIAKLPNFARIMRATVMSAREQEYVTASKVMGISNWKILLEDILPNSLSPMIVQATLGIAFAILRA